MISLQGPEPEAIETGNINGVDLIFVGIERPGFVVIFSLQSNGLPQFESITYSGGYGDTYENLYDNRIARDLDPEDLR